MTDRRTGTRRTSRGFTLIELIVALGVLTMVLAISLSTLRLGQRGWRVGDQIQADAQWPAFRDGVAERLAAAAPVAIDGTDGRRRLLFEGEPDRVRFVAPSASGVGHGLMEWELRRPVYAAVGGIELVSRAFRRGIDTSAGEWSRVGTLGGRTGSIAIRYYGDHGGSAGRGWQGRWTASTRMPELVELRLVGIDHRLASQAVPLTIALRQRSP